MRLHLWELSFPGRQALALDASFAGRAGKVPVGMTFVQMRAVQTKEARS